MSEPDELYTLRNLFWLGNFQLAINEGGGLNRLPQHLVVERDEFIYRSYLALGQFHVILGEIKDTPNTPMSLQAIRLLATFYSDPSSKEAIKFQLDDWLSNAAVANNPTVKLVYAILCVHDDNLKDAMKQMRAETNMEQCAFLVQLYLRIDRPDLAQKMVKQMKTKDEDGTLTMLATAWTHINAGGSKAQDAAYIYEELIDKYGSSAALLNGLAVAKMQQGMFEEAESSLLEALTKAPSDPDTLSNLIVVGQHLQRSVDVLNRYIAQLRSKSANHPLIASLEMFNGAYDRVSSSLSV